MDGSADGEKAAASSSNNRYSAPPNFYHDTPTSSPDLTPQHIPRAQTIHNPTDNRPQRHRLCSDSADEEPSSLAPPAGQALPRPQAPTEHGGSDIMKRAVAFLRRSGRSKCEHSSDSPNRHSLTMNGHAPTPPVGQSHSAYISSDNDSEFEDADMRKELQKLREK